MEREEVIHAKQRENVMSTTNETTTKQPIFTRKDLIALISPLVVEQILTVTMGLADTYMEAGVGEAAVSSVSLVDSLNILILQILSALATGGAVVCGQYLGRRDEKRAKKCAAQLYFVLMVSTIAVMLAVMCTSRLILRGVFGSIDDDVMQLAQIYFLISAVSYPFMGVYQAGAALFRAQGDSRTSLNASLVMNVINVCGNALLIYGFHLGVLGAALATLAGRVFAAGWILIQNQKTSNPYRMDEMRDMKPEKSYIMPILSIGIPSGLENGMFQIGKLCVSSLTSTLGTAAIAANAVANTVTTVANIPGNAMGLAIIPVVSRCIGAGDKKQANHYAKLLMGIAMGGLAITNIILYFAIPGVATAFHLSEAASAMCVGVVHWFCIFSIFCWALSFTMPNVLRSGGDSKYTMVVSSVSMWLFRVILSYFFVLKLHMGLTGVWFGMFIDWICRDIFFLIRFIGGKWMNHKLI